MSHKNWLVSQGYHHALFYMVPKNYCMILCTNLPLDHNFHILLALSNLSKLQYLLLRVSALPSLCRVSTVLLAALVLFFGCLTVIDLKCDHVNR